MSCRWKLFVVECRVLGVRRAMADKIYWQWVDFWMMRIPVEWWGLFGIIGWRAYFEYRDLFEYPAIGRWESIQWQKRRKALEQ